MDVINIYFSLLIKTPTIGDKASDHFIDSGKFKGVDINFFV